MAGTEKDDAAIKRVRDPVSSLRSEGNIGFDGDNVTHNSTGLAGNTESENNREEAQQAELVDVLFPLPEGWPHLQEKLFKRRNLYFHKPTSPSVSKAVQLIQKLQDSIVAWSREMELEILSRRSSEFSNVVVGPSYEGGRHGLGSKLTAGRKHLQFVLDSAHSTKFTDWESEAASRSVSKMSSVASSDVSGLSVRGMGATVPQDVDVAMAIDIPDDELPKLRAEEVIDEVVLLLGRLEADRLDSEESLEKEKQRVDWLQGKIDRLSHKRLIELPKAVQKEHEACAADIAELKWHCSYRGRQLNRVSNKVENAEMLNARLKEDIAFVKKHCPLVEEKLELEMEAMKRIDEAQGQTTAEFDKTLEKLNKTEMKSHEAHGKADMERAHIKRELDSVRDALNEINSELDEAKALHVSYCHMCNDLRRNLLGNAQEKVVQETRNENSRTAEKMELQRVKRTQEMIVVAEFEHRRLADQNYQFNIKIDAMRGDIKKLQDEADVASRRRLKDLRFRQQRCNEMTMDIEDIEVKLKQCTKQRVDDAKNMERIKREMVKLEMQLGVVNEEHGKTKVINSALNSKLSGEKDRVTQKEQHCQTTIAGLKKHHKEETHSRTVLQARILSDTADLQNSQTDAERKRAKVGKKREETEEMASGVLGEVEGRRETKTKLVKTIDDLETSVGDLKAKHTQMERRAIETKLVLEPKRKKIQGDYLETQKKLDHMKSKTDFFCKKLDEQSQSENFMDRVIKNTSEAIDELNVDLEEETIKLETGHRQEQDLKQSLTEVSERLGQGDDKHVDHMKTRRDVLEEHETKLKENLQTNQSLAHEYRHLQQDHHKLKTDLLKEFEVRVGLEESLKDHKQLNGLQIRLHDALARYFTLRGRYHKNELDGFEGSSAANAGRILSLRGEMDRAIQTIGTFLSDQLQDGTATVAAATNSDGREERTIPTDAFPSPGGNKEIVGGRRGDVNRKRPAAVACT